MCNPDRAVTGYAGDTNVKIPGTPNYDLFISRNSLETSSMLFAASFPHVPSGNREKSITEAIIIFLVA